MDIVECHLLSTIVDEENAHRTFVIRLGNRSESLLTSCVPNLQFDILIHYIDCFYSEVDSYGGHVAGRELGIGESQEETSFTY